MINFILVNYFVFPVFKGEYFAITSCFLAMYLVIPLWQKNFFIQKRYEHLEKLSLSNKQTNWLKCISFFLKRKNNMKLLNNTKPWCQLIYQQWRKNTDVTLITPGPAYCVQQEINPKAHKMYMKPQVPKPATHLHTSAHKVQLCPRRHIPVI